MQLPEGSGQRQAGLRRGHDRDVDGRPHLPHERVGPRPDHVRIVALPLGLPGRLDGLPRTMEQLDDVLDQIDKIVPPGSDIGQLDMAYRPPAIQQPALRRRPAGERNAA
jgi:hypothetical protein